MRKLCEKLRDPEFRKIEGFPLWSDEDILALSDPPYYTACPNPFMFQLTPEEYQSLRFQFRILKKSQHSKYLPYAFTEQGIAMFTPLNAVRI